MSDFVISQIRTYVPIVVGAIIAWFVAQGILTEESAAEAQNALVIALTALIQGAYYLAVRLLANRWPSVGNLLGVNIKPTYAGSVDPPA